jgi:hypothetical protein
VNKLQQDIYNEVVHLWCYTSNTSQQIYSLLNITEREFIFYHKNLGFELRSRFGDDKANYLKSFKKGI